MFRFFRRNKQEPAAPVEEQAPPAAPAISEPRPPRLRRRPARRRRISPRRPRPPRPPRRRSKRKSSRSSANNAGRLEQSLQRTRRGFFSQIGELFAADEITPALWDDLQDLLVLGDCGVETTNFVLDALERQVTRERIKRAGTAYGILKDLMVAGVGRAVADPPPAVDGHSRCRGPTSSSSSGVNGTGKTTTIAKLARYLPAPGQRRVVLAAGDTFRAAAIDQLEIWAERVGAPVMRAPAGRRPRRRRLRRHGGRPRRNADVLIIDTAGRLHTKFNLMEELRRSAA